MRRTTWDSMLDADLNAIYWSHLSRRYYNKDKFAKIFLATMASGTVASWGFWSDVQVVWKILSAISALMAVALPILNWPKMIESMVNLKQKWTQIRSDYEMLWIELNRGKDKRELERQYKKIKQKETKLSQEESNLPNDRKLLYKCRGEVLKSRGLT